MKWQGSKFEYEKERNDDLMRNYRNLLESSPYICMTDIYKQIVMMPAARFWVSEERATIVIASMIRGESISKMTKNKQEMFQEIFRRVQRIRKETPGITIYEACFTVVRQPAPKFYLTPGSAKVMICRTKKTWYEERKRKLRHLF